jgi:FHS family L-fucose permease-like MFS transporter
MNGARLRMPDPGEPSGSSSPRSVVADLKAPIIPREYLLPFLLVTTLFALWGFANDITNPMVAAFKNVLLISNFESALVQTAFYGGYCAMAIPAALFIHRTSYRSGILMGLALYATGCLLFVPAGWSMAFTPFLLAYFIMTCGLAFLETTANPYILAMGPEHNAARRLNFAQAFNPMGSLLGMLVAKDLILARINPMDEVMRSALAVSDPGALQAIQRNDIYVIVVPYFALGLAVLAALLVFFCSRLPEGEVHSQCGGGLGATIKRLLANRRYVGGVAAQAFYVGAQIMCWTFIIQYAENELGMSKEVAQGYNIIAMITFVCSRFLCTYLLKFFNPGLLLGILGIGGILLTLGAILLPGVAGLYCLVAVSACMSLMFPTIYGIALKGLGEDAKLGSAGLICAIGGGAVMPPLQALIMDYEGMSIGTSTISATRISFMLPLFCFIVVSVYGFACFLSRQLEAARPLGTNTPGSSN